MQLKQKANQSHRKLRFPLKLVSSSHEKPGILQNVSCFRRESTVFASYSWYFQYKQKFPYKTPGISHFSSHIPYRTHVLFIYKESIHSFTKSYTSQRKWLNLGRALFSVYLKWEAALEVLPWSSQCITTCSHSKMVDYVNHNISCFFSGYKRYEPRCLISWIKYFGI